MTTIHRSATISDCGLYRYELRRLWHRPGDCVCWIMLNPSTADAEIDDPTIRRCIGFSRAWGFGKLVVVNLFAFRATRPADLRRCDDPIGPENDDHIANWMLSSKLTVAAWGKHGSYRDRARKIRAMAERHAVELRCLGVTKAGEPKHPLYLSADMKPVVLDTPAPAGKCAVCKQPLRGGDGVCMGCDATGALLG